MANLKQGRRVNGPLNEIRLRRETCPTRSTFELVDLEVRLSELKNLPGSVSTFVAHSNTLRVFVSLTKCTDDLPQTHA